MHEPIVFTDSAAAKVADLIAEEGNPELKLRVFVQGGGCSGFQYGFTFDEIVNDDDTTMTKHGVSLLIDAMSYQYLIGAEIDYKEDLQGAQFVIKNPNGVTTFDDPKDASILYMLMANLADVANDKNIGAILTYAKRLKHADFLAWFLKDLLTGKPELHKNKDVVSIKLTHGSRLLGE
jgi:iron-sulfur cluster insertion protein